MTTPEDDVRGLLRHEFRARGIPVREGPSDDALVITIEGAELTVGLDNLARNFARDRDAHSIPAFVDGLLAARTSLPPWPEAASGMRFSAEPADHDFGRTVHERVTPGLCRVLAYTDRDELRISWVTPSVLSEWGISAQVASQAAAANMNHLLADATLEVQDVQGVKLGLFSTASVFKASLIFCSDLKALLSSSLGWPVHVVIPCRDFLYAFADPALIPRLGAVVMREYGTSGYPVTAEVLRIDDSGVQALGRFGA